MYQNTVAVPRLDLAGAIRDQDADLADYVAHQLFPVFPVSQRAASIPSLLTTDDQVVTHLKHAPKTPYQRVQATVDSKNYSCEEAGIEEPLSAEDYDVLGQDQAEAIATQRGMQIILRAREAALAGALTGSTGETLFTGQVTTPDIAENWGEATGAPIDDVAKADLALSTRIGAGPRWLVLGAELLKDLQVNTQIRTEYRRIVGQVDASATFRKINLDILAQILGVDRILVGNGRKNTANKGQAASYSFIWPHLYALLVRGVTNPSDLTSPALGRMFKWDNANRGAEAEVTMDDPLYGLTVESYRDEAVKSDIIRVTEYNDMAVLNVKAGELIKLPASD